MGTVGGGKLGVLDDATRNAWTGVNSERVGGPGREGERWGRGHLCDVGVGGQAGHGRAYHPQAPLVEVGLGHVHGLRQCSVVSRGEGGASARSDEDRMGARGGAAALVRGQSRVGESGMDAVGVMGRGRVMTRPMTCLAVGLRELHVRHLPRADGQVVDASPGEQLKLRRGLIEEGVSRRVGIVVAT